MVAKSPPKNYLQSTLKQNIVIIYTNCYVWIIRYSLTSVFKCFATWVRIFLMVGILFLEAMQMDVLGLTRQLGNMCSFFWQGISLHLSSSFVKRR